MTDVDIADMTIEDLARRVRTSTPDAYLRAECVGLYGWRVWRLRRKCATAFVHADGRTLLDALRALVRKLDGGKHG